MRYQCRICGNTEKKTHYVAREMMYGLRDEFDYFMCPKCECLQISEIPDNLNKYYPDDYCPYSAGRVFKQSKIKWHLKRQRARHLLGDRNVTGRILSWAFGNTSIPGWAKLCGITVDSKTLDIGCGAGSLLLLLQSQGFTNLTGVDPYIPKEPNYDNGVRILKKDVSDIEGSFDFIMLHHSFEHVIDPADTLRTIHNITARNGIVLLRIPTVSSLAWRKYNEKWVQLDAPRHLHIHSLKSIELLSKNFGFEVESIVFDSSAFQFLGSEQYIKDIPLRDPRSYRNGVEGSIFTEMDINHFEIEAKKLNEAGDGDQACFVLRKVN